MMKEMKEEMAELRERKESLKGEVEDVARICRKMLLLQRTESN